MILTFKRLDFMEYWIITIYIEILQKKIHVYNALKLYLLKINNYKMK